MVSLGPSAVYIGHQERNPFACHAPLLGQVQGCLERHHGSGAPFVLGEWLTWWFFHAPIPLASAACRRCVTLFPVSFPPALCMPVDVTGWNGGTVGEWLL